MTTQPAPASRPTVGSLFSGIGGFDLGLERAGFEVAWQCEIDPFCQKVLAAHWPEVVNHGDVSRTRFEQHGQWGNHQESGCEQTRVDLICGGFPCQDLSVAGKRAGLAGERSGLWFEFHRILSELRPTFCLIENVPGLLSSNQGRDFGLVLAGLGELWPAVGWAVLDSQYFGVPQRRRRVYIVGGPTRASVQQVLSLCEGGDWHPQTRREAGEDVAGTLRGGTRGTDDPDRSTYVPELAYALASRDHKGVNQREGQTTLVAHSLSADGFDASEDGTGRGTPLVFQQNQRDEVRVMPIAGALPSQPGMKQQNYIAGASVRRLTPIECERLQGFPDGWTDIDGAKDGPRYKALGNAVTVPVIEYLGLRLMAVLQ